MILLITSFLLFFPLGVVLGGGHFVEIGRKYSQYKTKIHPSFKSTGSFQLINLELYVTYFQDCLLHIINFNGYDFISTSPAILSRYDIIKLSILELDLNNKTTVPRPIRRTFLRKVPFEKIFRFNSLGPCKQDWLQRECMVENVDIPLLDLTMKTKPWQCEAHFYLDPPSPVESRVFYEEQVATRDQALIIPGSYRKFWRESASARNAVNGSLQPPYVMTSREIFEVLILDKFNRSALRLQMMTKAWSAAVLEILDMFGMQDIFVTSRRELLVILASQLLQNSLKNTLSQNKLMISENIGILCRYCVPCKPLTLVSIGNPKSRQRLQKYLDI